MAKYTIANIQESILSNSDLEKYYAECKKEISSSKGLYPGFNFIDLDIIFQVACGNRSLFPNITVGINPTPKSYINRWILAYCSAINNPPSQKIASPKTSCNDPIIKTIIKTSQNITDDNASIQVTTHNLCMSAENVLGNILEEYISQKIRSYKWVWCAGETLRAIDFCNEKGTILLQVKNKNNSENSSSSNIRNGTTIKKWFRLGTTKKGKVLSPSYKWNKLNNIINSDLPVGMTPINLTENDFHSFIEKVVMANPTIITGE